MARRRADELLVARGLFDSVEQAARAIYAADIVVDHPPLETPLKPGTLLPESATLRSRRAGAASRYVSRGGDKLEGALRAFAYDPMGVNALDAGASTGGFTDCLIQHGAARVAAVDVGYGQLAWTLREDPRVAVFERTNIRDVDATDIGGPFDLAVADLSFISLGKVAARIASCLTESGRFIALVKPQFEAERSEVGARGVVESAEVHRQVLTQAAADLESCGLSVDAVAFSPITGPEGNIEFWIESSRGGSGSRPTLDTEIGRIVNEAHRAHRPR